MIAWASYDWRRSSELLTIAEAAKILKASVSTIRAWIRAGRLPSVKVGHFRRVRPDDLEAFIEAGREARKAALSPPEASPRSRRFLPLTPEDPLFQLIGIGDSRLKDVAEQHDRYLAEALLQERGR